MAMNWPNYFTGALRKNPQWGTGWWGTLEQGQTLLLGDCGYIDSTGNYHHVGMINLIPYLSEPSDWVAQPSASVTDSQVKQGTVNGAISGKFIDPETGLEVNGGVKSSWTFDQSNQILANLPLCYYQSYDPSLMQPVLQSTDVLQQLIVMANPVGYTTAAGYLKPGFVVVYGIAAVVSGFVVGATSKSATFTISGTLSGVDGVVSGSADAGYTTADVDSGSFKWIWPAAGITDPSQLNGPDKDLYLSDVNNKRVFAFKAFSFNGDTPIQDWQP